MRTSPTTQIPADQTSSSELMQKKLIVCPISSHEPVSVTFRKNVIVITDEVNRREVQHTLHRDEQGTCHLSG